VNAINSVKPNLFRRLFAKKPLVSILNLSGVIAKQGRFSISLDSLNDSIEKAFSFPNLRAVLLVINSPGGSPVQSELIADRIISLSAKNKVPVYSFIEDVGASGGYWLACAGEKIFSSANSIVGSIGVISTSFGFTEIAKKLGIERRIRTQGKNKVISDPFLPEDPEKIAILLEIYKQVHASFVEYVRSRRGMRLQESATDLFDGRVWTGNDAVKFGLIDGIQNVRNFAEEEFGGNVKLKFIKKKDSWMRRSFGLDLISDLFDATRASVSELFLNKF